MPLILLPNLQLQLGASIPQVVLKLVDLLVSEAPVHRPVRDPVAFGRLSRLGVGELVGALDPLHEIPGDAPRQLEEIVLDVSLGSPEGNVLEDGRILGVGFERRDLARLELRVEPLVVRPEETDVGNLEEDHGEAFESQAEGPPVTLGHVHVGQHLGVHDAASQNLEPFPLVHDLHLEGRLREGEVIVGPTLLARPEEMIHETLQHLLQVVRDHLALAGFDPFVVIEILHLQFVLVVELHPLELMERGIVRRVDLVPAVHVPRAQETLVTLPEVLRLMRRRVRPQKSLVGDVVRVAGRPSGMIGGDPQIVEALGGRDDRILRVEDGELVVEAGEVLLDLGADDPYGMILLEMQSASDELGDVGGDVVRRMIDGVPLRGRELDGARGPFLRFGSRVGREAGG
mmetsp:Transcript_33540/g.99943  ORF Transcript_33540/g.99943 Transcript_33540/m.99943 type:complete len:401 (+) Transcript_33540:437-1639(+)